MHPIESEEGREADRFITLLKRKRNLRMDGHLRLEIDAYSIWPSATLSECRLSRDGKTGGVLLMTISDISNKYVGRRTFYEASVGRHLQCLPREEGAPVSPKQHG